jgi:hypothetical protein
VSNQIPERMVSESKPVRALAYVAAASVVLAGGLPPLTPDQFDWIGPAVGLVGLVATALLAVRTEGKVTPWEDVAAKQTPSGAIVAGPAATQPNGTSVVVSSASTVAPKYNDPMEGDAL